MGKTYRSWQKRSGWQVSRHYDEKRKHFGKRKDRFRFDPRKEYEK